MRVPHLFISSCLQEIDGSTEAVAHVAAQVTVESASARPACGRRQRRRCQIIAGRSLPSTEPRKPVTAFRATDFGGV